MCNSGIVWISEQERAIFFFLGGQINWLETSIVIDIGLLIRHIIQFHVGVITCENDLDHKLT